MGEGFVFVHLGATPVDRTARRERVAQFAHGWRTTRWASWSPGQVLTYEVAANYKVIAENYNECYHCGPVHPELTRLVPTFGGGGTGIDWEGGVPHREGAWTFTMSGTTDRAPLPGLDEAERTRHKGELVHPNLMSACSADHVAAFVLLPQVVDRTRIECLLLFHPSAVADPGVRPVGRRRPLGPGQPAGLGDLRVGAARHVVAGLPHGWFAPMEDDRADIRRWLLPRLAARPMPERVDYVVVGLGRARLGDRVPAGPARALGARAGAVRARPPPRREPRHQPDPAAQLPHAGVRRPHRRRRTTTGRGCREASGETLVTKVGGLDLFPPDAAIPLDDYTGSR